MFTCPNCHTGLARSKTEKGLFFVCPTCRGRTAGLAVLRRTIAPECIKDLWRQARDPSTPSGKRCAICRRPMRAVAVPLVRCQLPLDVCLGCEFVWFDAGELADLPALQSSPPRPLPEKAREELAKAELRLDEMRRKQADAREEAPAETWQWIPAILGMPVEIGGEAVRHIAWLSWGLAACLVAVFTLTRAGSEEAVQRFAFVPAAAFRAGGITWLTSFFLHAGLLHLVGNVYFLVVFGRHVEDYLGRWRYLLLLVGATVAGDLTHLLLDPRLELPCVGASGGISGVIVFYACKFPRARLGLLVMYYYVGRWLNISAAALLIIWLVLQVWGAFLQIHGTSIVSNLAHLGGAVIGLLAWFAWQHRQG